MTHFDDYVKKIKDKQAKSLKIWQKHDQDICMLCGAHGGDKRSLWIQCMYAVDEVVPEALDMSGVPDFRDRGYYLLICKSCRAELLLYLERWRNHMISRKGMLMDHDGNLEDTRPEANIPMRINGAIRMLTMEEYDELKGEE